MLTILFVPFPDTPYWLVENNKLELAKKSLEFYRGNQYNIAEELFEISQKHESKQRNSENDSGRAMKSSCIHKYLSTKIFGCFSKKI